jgi:Zn-dependent peptidase ImmA (M78 family)
MLNQRDRVPNRQRIRGFATRLLKECQIINPPVRIGVIAKKLDLIVESGNPAILDLFIKKNLSAFISLEDKIVVYNSTHPTVRNRFSVAHEIGHFILGHSFNNDIFNLNSQDPREIEANIFASELLMPFGMIKRDIVLGERVPGLAKIYWVSEEAVGWRLFNSDALLK